VRTDGFLGVPANVVGRVGDLPASLFDGLADFETSGSYRVLAGKDDSPILPLRPTTPRITLVSVVTVWSF